MPEMTQKESWREEPVRVALVDDHRVVRQGLRAFLESFPDLRVVGEASSGEEALRLMGGWRAGVVVMDLLMPGGMDGVATIRVICERWPQTRLIALTSFSDDSRVLAVLRAGAVGYVRKDAAPDILLAAVRAAARGQALVDPAVAGAVLQQVARPEKPEHQLSEREMAVLNEMALGYTNKEIAERLILSPETVKSHVASILGKFGLAHRMQAVIYALKHGLISLDELDV